MIAELFKEGSFPKSVRLIIGVASGMAGRALALPIMPPERDIAARVTIELFAEYSLAHVIYVCAQPIIFSLLRPCLLFPQT